MKTRLFSINFLLQNFLLFCIGIFTITSCKTDDVVKQAITGNYLKTRSLSTPSIPSNFFYSSDVGLSSIIETLQRIDSEVPFAEKFQEEYGIPLWDYTYNIEDEFYFVPLYDDEAPMVINAIWFFHVVDRRMSYTPLKRDDDLIGDNDQQFLFDLLSYLVFGINNAYGYIFKEHMPKTRTWITITTCWDVYTGSGSEDNLKYSYTNCIDKTMWVDIPWHTLNLGTGTDEVIGGGGNTENSSSANNSKDIFRNENLSNDTWKIINLLIEEIQQDCMGASLYNNIKNHLSGDKIRILIIDGLESSYNWNTKTLSLGINSLESNVFLHELMHLYQTLKEPTPSFESALLNREIEAHYAQYLYLRKQPIWEDKYKDIYNKNSRGRAIEKCNYFFDEHGHLKNGTIPDIVEVLFSEQIIPYFCKEEPYKSYSFDNSLSISSLFSNIEVLTKNCK